MSAQATPPSPLIGFIGAGNIARALAGGLIHSGWDRRRLLLADPDAAQRDSVAQRLGLEVHADNAAVATRADILVLAVKPQALAPAATALAAVTQRKQPLVVSVAAGVRIGDLERWLGGALPVVRVMPNTAVLVGAGASGLYANARVTQTMREQAESILRAVGVTVWVEREEQLDLVTALSGSGPAYFFLVVEALEQAAVEQGLPPATARLLALQTAYGAAKMALEDPEEPAVLRRHVTSPGGTTEQGIRVLEEGGLRTLLGNALAAAARRARELGELFGRNA